MLVFMYYLCEKYYKPIAVQCYKADCLNWILRLTLLVHVCSVMSNSLWPQRLWPTRLLYGIFQARILEWVAISYSKGIFPTQGSNPCLLISCIGSWILYCCATWETLNFLEFMNKLDFQKHSGKKLVRMLGTYCIGGRIPPSSIHSDSYPDRCFWLIASYKISRRAELEKAGDEGAGRYTDCSRNDGYSLVGDPGMITGENQPSGAVSWSADLLSLLNRLREL